MKPHLIVPALVILMLPPASAQAQHGGASPSALPTAPAEARQFDFLVGNWEITVRPKVSSLAARIHGQPTMPGTWRATRSFDGWGIDDELRILDAGGNTRSLTRALRVYDPSAQRWTMTTLDVYRSRFTPSTATWQDNAMTVTSSGTDQEGKAYITRGRFYDISAAGFKWQQDRSYDNGQTWDEAILRIEARRR